MEACTTSGRTALFFALCSDRTDASCFQVGTCPLSDPSASFTNNACLPMVQMLVEAGINMHTTDALGRGVLHHAIILGADACIQIILEYAVRSR